MGLYHAGGQSTGCILWQLFTRIDNSMPTQSPEPTGELLLRTLAMPADTNPNGDIFGGWIISQMDIAGSILAKETAQGRTVTVAVDSIQFHKPVKVGDVVCCYGEISKIGTTSITIRLEVWINPVLRQHEVRGQRFKVTQATFTYVAIDEQGRKRPVRG